MNLSYCYNKIGNLAQADFYKNLLVKNFSEANLPSMLLHPEALILPKKIRPLQSDMTIFITLFIEGNFDEAHQRKTIGR